MKWGLIRVSGVLAFDCVLLRSMGSPCISITAVHTHLVLDFDLYDFLLSFLPQALYATVSHCELDSISNSNPLH